MAWSDFSFYKVNATMQADGNIFLHWDMKDSKAHKFLAEMLEYMDGAFFNRMIRGKKHLGSAGTEFEVSGEDEKYEVIGIHDKETDEMWFYDNQCGASALADDLLCDGEVILIKSN